jgi:hypothetical protein
LSEIEPSFRDLANPDDRDFFDPGFPFILCDLVRGLRPPLAPVGRGEKGEKNTGPPRRQTSKQPAPAGVWGIVASIRFRPELQLLPLKIPH